MGGGNNMINYMIILMVILCGCTNESEQQRAVDEYRQEQSNIFKWVNETHPGKEYTSRKEELKDRYIVIVDGGGYLLTYHFGEYGDIRLVDNVSRRMQWEGF